MSTNNERNGGDTPSHGGDITFTKGKTTPPKEPGIDAHFEKSGDVGDIFRFSGKDVVIIQTLRNMQPSVRNHVFSSNYNSEMHSHRSVKQY
jgi:hypothetical protein